MIDCHFWPTPNGHKVTIMLEETGLPYRLVPVNIGRGEQFSPQFLAIGPNNRMPAIVDREPLGGGPPLSVFESGAILMYLAEKSSQLWPQTPREKYEIVQWVFWQMANQGPKSGELGNFKRAAASGMHGDLAYGLKRFDDEVNRLYGVLDNRLCDRRFIAGENYSIADIVSFPWAARWEGLGQNIGEFKHVKRWLDEVGAREAVQRGLAVGKDLTNSVPSTPQEQERLARILQNQRARPTPG